METSFSRCCHLQSRVLWQGHRDCSQHPVQNAWLQKAALGFLNLVYSIWGAKRREFISTVENHIPSNYKDAEILPTGSHTQPRIDFSLQLGSHGFLVISFCSLLLEDIYNTAVLTFNRKPLDKATWSLFFIVRTWKFQYLYKLLKRKPLNILMCCFTVKLQGKLLLLSIQTILGRAESLVWIFLHFLGNKFLPAERQLTCLCMELLPCCFPSFSST